MADICGNLWEFNLVRVIVVDVTDDYRLMQPPMPSDFYPVITEKWLPRHNLSHLLSHDLLVHGYLYDWHETPDFEGGSWYVGMVHEDMALVDASHAA
jgi:hypothetical protein